MSSPEDRFAALFERTHVALLGYAVRRVADPADAADIVAETFLVAWRRLDEVPGGSEARPWLFGVARRLLANHYRGERRRNALADRLRETLPAVVRPPTAGESTIQAALGRLSQDDQEILRLVAWEELAREEIAVALGVSRAAVRVRLHRARQRLTTAMKALDEELNATGKAVAVKRNPIAGHVAGEWANACSGAEEGS